MIVIRDGSPFVEGLSEQGQHLLETYLSGMNDEAVEGINGELELAQRKPPQFGREASTAHIKTAIRIARRDSGLSPVNSDELHELARELYQLCRQ